MPLIGFLGGGLLGPSAPYVAAFRKELSELGYVEGDQISAGERQL